MTTVSYKDLSIEDMTFTTPERIGNSYMCNLYHDDSLVYVQTPILEVSNVNISDDEDDNYIEITSDNKQFIDFLLEMEDNCVKSTFDNSGDWFKKDIPYEAIDNMYKEKDIDMYEEENKYLTKFRLPVLNNKVQCNIFNKDKEIIDISELNEKNIIMILHFKGLKILKDSFYLDCYINQIKVIDTNKYNILEDYAIIEDYEDHEIDENMFEQEIQEILDQEKLEKEKIELEKLHKIELEKREKIKSDKLEQINKLKEELNNLI